MWPARAPRCRPICHGGSITTCPRAPPVAKVAGRCASEKSHREAGLHARGFTVERQIRGTWFDSSRKTPMRPPCQRTSSTRASRARACWPRCRWLRTTTTCLCTARNTTKAVVFGFAFSRDLACARLPVPGNKRRQGQLARQGSAEVASDLHQQLGRDTDLSDCHQKIKQAVRCFFVCGTHKRQR